MKEAIITTPIMVFSCYLRLLGQATPPLLDPGLSTLIGNLGVIGVLIWHLWYHTTHSQPQMLKDFSAEAAKIRADREAERSANAREMTELRNMLLEVLKGFRTAAHDVKDTAQTAINKIALTKAEIEREKL